MRSCLFCTVSRTVQVEIGDLSSSIVSTVWYNIHLLCCPKRFLEGHMCCHWIGGYCRCRTCSKTKNIFLKCSATTNTHTAVNNRQTHHHISILQRKKQTFCHTIGIKQNAYVQAWLHRKSKATTQETYALFGYNGYTILLLTEQGLVTRLRIALNYTLRGHCVQWYYCSTYWMMCLCTLSV